MMGSQNVGLNMDFLINNILATKKQQKQQKQHLHKKCDFEAKSTFWLFFTFFTFFSKRGRVIGGKFIMMRFMMF